MNTEYEQIFYLPRKNLARWGLSLEVNPRSTLAKSPGVFKFGPSASLHLVEHQAGGCADAVWFSNVFVPPCSGRCFLCWGTSFCSAGKMGHSVLGDFGPRHVPQPPHRPSPYAAHPKERNPPNRRPSKPRCLFPSQSHTFTFPADWGNGKIATDIRGTFPRSWERGFSKGIESAPPVNKWPPPLSHQHSSLSPPSHPAYRQQLEEAPQTRQREIYPKSTSY